MGTIVGFLGEAKHLEAVMRFLGRHAYGRLACLAVLAVIALVACGAGPGATKTQDPVGFKNIELRQGSTSEISLVNTFSGSDLTYTAKSDKPAVATVSVDEDKETLTVRAVGPGTATITVTATDPQKRSHPQDFTVTVPKAEDDGTGGEEEGAPTVRTGAPGSYDVDQGDTQTVPLSRVFTGEDLEFSVSSDDTGVATASEDDGILTITARSPGGAAITIVATNDAGTATHRIAVTVPEPATTPPDTTPEPQPSVTCKAPPLTFTITINRGRTKQCTIPKDHTLEEEAGSGVSAVPVTGDETATLWKITAKKRGTHGVTIFDGSAKVGTISVVVPNSLPFRNATADPDPMVPIVLSELPGETGALDLESYFSDEDEDTDTTVVEEPFRYRIVKPNWVLVDTNDGFVDTTHPDTATDTKLRVEVLNKIEPGKIFPVSIYAVDSAGGESELPVVLTFGPPSVQTPRSVSDYMSQQTENGALGKKALEVGPRRGVPHTLTFKQSDTVAGFRFVADATLNTSRLPSGAVTEAAGLFYKTGSVIRNANGLLPKHGDISWVSGYHYYVLESSVAVEEPRWGAANDLAGVPQVTFKLKESGRSGSITISYYVVYGTSADVDVPATSATRIDRKSLSVTVVTCSSPPVPIDDCP